MRSCACWRRPRAGPKYKAALGVAYGAGLRVSGGRDLQACRTSTASACCSASSRARAEGPHMACCRRGCWQLLRDWWVQWPARRAGCFRAATRCCRSRPASSTVPVTSRRCGGDREAWCRRIRSGTVRHAPAGAGRRYSRDPGVVGPCEVRHDGALRARREQDAARRRRARSIC